MEVTKVDDHEQKTDTETIKQTDEGQTRREESSRQQNNMSIQHVCVNIDELSVLSVMSKVFVMKIRMRTNK